MKVCFFLGSLNVNGGIGRVVSIIANELKSREGIEPHLLAYYDNVDAEHYRVSVPSSVLLDKRMPMTKALLKGAIGRLKSYLKENEIDILVAAGVVLFPLSIAAAKQLKIPCICWEHCNVKDDNDIVFEKLCRKIAAKTADRIVTLTKQDEKDYVNLLGAKKVSQIYNPAEAELIARAGEYDPDTKRIISVGRIGYQKNFEAAVEVAKTVLGKYPDWSWDIFGDGEGRDDLEALIEREGLKGRLNLLGRVPDLYDRYKDYSVQVMTSRYEGFPMALIEGGVNGIPAVSFDIYTGPNEIIENGESGYLIEPLDTDKMAEAVCRLIDSREQRISMSKRAKEIALSLDVSKIADEWVELLTQYKN